MIPIIDGSAKGLTTPWWLILLFEACGLLFAFAEWRLMLRKWPWD
jgi:hypothetical protein